MKIKTVLLISVVICLLLINSEKSKANYKCSFEFFTGCHVHDIFTYAKPLTFKIEAYFNYHEAHCNYNYEKSLTGKDENTSYAIPVRSSDTNCSMWIHNITTSGGGLNINNTTACSDSSYTDFSGAGTVTNTQMSYTVLSFTSSGNAMSFSVWIDFNDDYVFDSTENVIAIDNPEGLFTITDSFLIPVFAIPGTYRMRIRGDIYSNGAPDDPCNQLQYGETEDYAFTILPAPQIAVVPDSLSESTGICSDSIISTLLIINNGTDTLDWNICYGDGDGNALVFNGTNAEVRFGDLGQMPEKGGVEFWMKVNQSSVSRMLFSTSGLFANWKGVNIYQYLTSLYLRIGDDYGVYTGYTITGNIVYGKWHHVAVTWDKTQNKVWTYFDGNVTTDEGSNTNWVALFSDVRLGIANNTSSNHFYGEIDEFRMWNDYRSPADISDFFREGLFVPPQGLAGLWEFDEPSGDTVCSFNSNIKGVLYDVSRTPSGAPIRDPQMTVSPTGGLLAEGDTSAVLVTFVTNGFNNGTHNSVVGVTTNDPLHPYIFIPSQVILNGQPRIELDDSVAAFPSLLAGVIIANTFKIYNTGCDTLKITAVFNDDPAFANVCPSFLLPRDSGIIKVSFSSSIMGLHTDTLTILNNSITKHLYLSGTVLPTPQLQLTPDTLPVSTNICTDTIMTTLQIINSGTYTMDLQVYFSEGAGNALSFNGSNSEVHFGNMGMMPEKGCVEFWMKTDVNTGARYAYSSSGLNNNLKGVNIYQYNNYLYLRIGNDNGTSNSYTITGNVGYGNWHHVAVTWDKTLNKVWTYFDGNNTTNGSYNPYWVTAFSDVRLGAGNSSATYNHFDGEIDGFRMWSEYRSAADIMNYYHEGILAPADDLTGMWEFNEPAGDTVFSYYSNKKGVLNNVSRVSSGAAIHDPQVNASPVSGLLAAGDTANIDVTFLTGGFNSGTYSSLIGLTTNDPLHQFVAIPTRLILNGPPQIELTDSTGIFPSVMAGEVVTDTFKIFNTGCDSLKITAVSGHDSAFIPAFPAFILPRDSGMVTISFYSLTHGIHSDTITILNNSGTRHIFVYGNILPTPELVLVPDTISVSTSICNDTIVYALQLINTGNDSLKWNMYYSTGAGNALSFNGSSSEARFGNHGPFPEKGCIEFWMKTNLNSTTKMLFSSSGLNSSYKGVNILQSLTKIYLRIGNDAGTNNTFTITANADYGHWHHVAATWDKTLNKVWTYFDGNVVANGSYNSYWPQHFQMSD
ncbi:MAG TPA: GEVED domain-containing protein [Bacteroidales bacterium]|nr:GEVED domain-containing protein [Bacteroidales bacterium]